jgi:hypothetical protein
MDQDRLTAAVMRFLRSIEEKTKINIIIIKK